MKTNINFSVLKPETDKYITMDALRFLAAAAVVVYHYRSGVETPMVREALDFVFERAYHFVDLFFILSGFIIAAVYSTRLATQRQIGGFILKRIARLWPLHLLLLGLYLGVWGASVVAGLPLNQPSKYDASCILPNVLMIHSLPLCGESLTFNYVSWSISAEMFMYLLAPMVLLLGRKPLVLVIGAALFFLCLCLLSFDAGWVGWTWHWGVLRALPAFLFGAALFKLRERLAIPRAHLLTLFALLTFFAISSTQVPSWLSLLVIYALAVFAAAADLQSDVPAWVKRVACLSPLTYGLYMWHPFVQTIGHSLLIKRIIDPSAAVADGLLVLIAVCAGVTAYLSLVYFEGPTRRFIVQSSKHQEMPESVRNSSI